MPIKKDETTVPLFTVYTQVINLKVGNIHSSYNNLLLHSHCWWIQPWIKQGYSELVYEVFETVHFVSDYVLFQYTREERLVLQYMFHL